MNNNEIEIPFSFKLILFFAILGVTQVIDIIGFAINYLRK